jgi:hypothetical protein
MKKLTKSIKGGKIVLAQEEIQAAELPVRSGLQAGATSFKSFRSFKNQD